MVSLRDFSAGLPTTTTPLSLSVATNVVIVGDHPDETRTPPASKDHGAEIAASLLLWIPEDSSMAVPKRKTSPSKRGMRRSADALQPPTYVEVRRPHHIHLKTGKYKGRQILPPRSTE